MVSARRLYCVKTSSQFKLFLANLNRISVLKSYSLFFPSSSLCSSRTPPRHSPTPAATGSSSPTRCSAGTRSGLTWRRPTPSPTPSAPAPPSSTPAPARYAPGRCCSPSCTARSSSPSTGPCSPRAPPCPTTPRRGTPPAGPRPRPSPGTRRRTSSPRSPRPGTPPRHRPRSAS